MRNATPRLRRHLPLAPHSRAHWALTRRLHLAIVQAAGAQGRLIPGRIVAAVPLRGAGLSAARGGCCPVSRAAARRAPLGRCCCRGTLQNCLGPLHDCPLLILCLVLVKVHGPQAAAAERRGGAGLHRRAVRRSGGRGGQPAERAGRWVSWVSMMADKFPDPAEAAGAASGSSRQAGGKEGQQVGGRSGARAAAPAAHHSSSSSLACSSSSSPRQSK